MGHRSPGAVTARRSTTVLGLGLRGAALAAGAGGALGLLLFGGGCMPDFDALTASPTTTSSTTTSGTGGAGGGKPECMVDADCPGKTCISGVCTVDPCLNMVRDGKETDIDCGGDVCDPCVASKSCKVNSDCKSNLCNNHACIDPSCTDGVRDLTETDIDCGGECAPMHQCGTDAKCSVASDCGSYLCNTTTLHCDPTDVVPILDMIDDMEAQAMSILKIGGRDGGWYSSSDGSGPVLGPSSASIPGTRAGSKFAKHTTGPALTGWGAAPGFTLLNPAGQAGGEQNYDASQYSGVQFWSRSDTDLGITVDVVDRDTDYGGGVCMVCDNFSAQVTATKEWTRHRILFTSLKQSGFGDKFQAFNPTQMIGMQFRVPPGQAFDFWIDDVAFIK